MAYFLFKRWPEQLFFAERKDIVICEAKIPVDFVPVTADNLSLVQELRDPVYVEQFRFQLGLGDFGYYAFHEGQAVAYGWVKRPGSEDYFYRIGEGARYLCRFFTGKDFRGNGIYPALIAKLVEKEADCDRFYIDIETGNEASRHGLEKAGFRFIAEYGFIRGFKHTFNKKWIG